MISTRTVLTACFLSFLFNGVVPLAVANDTLTPRSLHTSKQGNQYAGGSSVVIEKKVAGDLIAAGGSISVTQEVAKDAALAGGTIAVYAPVAEDLRAFGGDLSFGNEIGGELVAAGGKILLSERGHVSGSANLSGGQINIEGRIDGDLHVKGGQLLINGRIGGDALLQAENITFGPTAVIEGDVHYASSHPPQRDPGAQIHGSIQSEALADEWELPESGKLLLMALPIFLFGQWLMGALLLLIWPTALRNAADIIRERPARALFMGLGVLLVVPPLAVLLMVTVLGIPLGLLLLLSYPIALSLAYLTVAYLLGMSVRRMLKQELKQSYAWQLLTLVAGMIVLGVVSFIPLLNFLLLLVVLSMGLGAWAMRVSRSPG